ncbi:hypothetical protein BCR43DRAFT_126994 [Syncephalastrum racemosum]|uniref:Uncharacterized protein n=1 Tax=Syncephalastrum racemosum TaxID=13706 RepID=A0A1X2HKV8_SYNRA|nr:hypothetical protein BCR43DRAFT_126994 [Syncephalastrum racemosum]
MQTIDCERLINIEVRHRPERLYNITRMLSFEFCFDLLIFLDQIAAFGIQFLHIFRRPARRDHRFHALKVLARLLNLLITNVPVATVIALCNGSFIKFKLVWHVELTSPYQASWTRAERITALDSDE